MFNKVTEFEEQIAKFYNAPYAIATDCCTHAIELCLRMEPAEYVSCPAHTYLSIPMTFEKLNVDWVFTDEKWKDYYHIEGTKIIDAAVFWKEDSYIKNSLMCLSFQYQKHLSLGRGGAILCSTKEEYLFLKKSSYDGRLPNTPWADQDIDTIGYHYYMTPETALLGLEKLPKCIETTPKKRDWKTYPDLSKLRIFNEK